MDLNNLGDGTTYLRNLNLAKCAHQLGLVERLGTGIKLMQEGCRKAGLMPLEFIEGADSLKVIFCFMPDKAIATPETEQLLKFIKMRQAITVKDAALLLQVSHNTAARKLNQLIKAKTIKGVGKAPAVRYMLLNKYAYC